MLILIHTPIRNFYNKSHLHLNYVVNQLEDLVNDLVSERPTVHIIFTPNTTYRKICVYEVSEIEQNVQDEIQKFVSKNILGEEKTSFGFHLNSD